jgi:hypothetical protein
MKKIFYFLIVSILFISCNKEETFISLTDKSKLIGGWKLIKSDYFITEIEKDIETGDEYIYYFTALYNGDSLIFTENDYNDIESEAYLYSENLNFDKSGNYSSTKTYDSTTYKTEGFWSINDSYKNKNILNLSAGIYEDLYDELYFNDFIISDVTSDKLILKNYQGVYYSEDEDSEEVKVDIVLVYEKIK